MLELLGMYVLRYVHLTWTLEEFEAANVTAINFIEHQCVDTVLRQVTGARTPRKLLDRIQQVVNHYYRLYHLQGNES